MTTDEGIEPLNEMESPSDSLERKKEIVSTTKTVTNYFLHDMFGQQELNGISNGIRKRSRNLSFLSGDIYINVFLAIPRSLDSK